MRRALCLVLPCLVSLAGAITFTNDPNSFVPDDSIHWSQFGNGVSVPAGSAGLTTLGNPFEVLTDTLAINDTLYRGPATTGNTFDPVSLSFHLDVPVSAVGADVMPTWSSFGYTVELEAFNAGGISLGSITQHYDAGTGSVFLGAIDTASDIATITYTVGTDQPRVTSDFAIDHALLRTAVPEPATWLALGAGALALLRRKTK